MRARTALRIPEGTNMIPGAFDELIKMLTDLKTEIVASKTTDETADAFDEVSYLFLP